MYKKLIRLGWCSADYELAVNSSYWTMYALQLPAAQWSALETEVVIVLIICIAKVKRNEAEK